MLTTDEGTAMKIAARHTTIGSKLGDLTVVAREGTVAGLYFPHHWYRPGAASFGPYSDVGPGAVRDQVSGYLAGQRREFDVPMTTRGDEYQQRVWAPVHRVIRSDGKLGPYLGGPAA